MSGGVVSVDEVDCLIGLDEAIAEKEAELKELKATRAMLQEQIVEQWSAVGKQSETRRGKTIYRARELQCSTKSGHGDVLKQRLLEAGMDEMVREQVVMASLKSWVRERAQVSEDGELDFSQIPSGIMESLNVHEQFVVRVRKS